MTSTKAMDIHTRALTHTLRSSNSVSQGFCERYIGTHVKGACMITMAFNHTDLQ